MVNLYLRIILSVNLFGLFLVTLAGLPVVGGLINPELSHREDPYVVSLSFLIYSILTLFIIIMIILIIVGLTSLFYSTRSRLRPRLENNKDTVKFDVMTRTLKIVKSESPQVQWARNGRELSAQHKETLYYCLWNAVAYFKETYPEPYDYDRLMEMVRDLSQLDEDTEVDQSAFAELSLGIGHPDNYTTFDMAGTNLATRRATIRLRVENARQQEETRPMPPRSHAGVSENRGTAAAATNSAPGTVNINVVGFENAFRENQMVSSAHETNLATLKKILLTNDSALRWGKFIDSVMTQQIGANATYHSQDEVIRSLVMCGVAGDATANRFFEFMEVDSTFSSYKRYFKEVFNNPETVARHREAVSLWKWSSADAILEQQYLELMNGRLAMPFTNTELKNSYLSGLRRDYERFHTKVIHTTISVPGVGRLDYLDPQNTCAVKGCLLNLVHQN
ncbi:hypothetical protein BDR26DRAFT_902588 [Obelidium mucronatum]|nr:hypothetical protein BDR26DRAFT_902588 [Obelidium mucronatum]